MWLHARSWVSWWSLHRYIRFNCRNILYYNSSNILCSFAKSSGGSLVRASVCRVPGQVGTQVNFRSKTSTPSCFSIKKYRSTNKLYLCKFSKTYLYIHAACPPGTYKYSVSNVEGCIQAPFDNSSYCRSNPRFAHEHVFPSKIKLHFDSHHYQNLIEDANPVWKRRDFDGDRGQVSTNCLFHTECEGAEPVLAYPMKYYMFYNINVFMQK